MPSPLSDASISGREQDVLRRLSIFVDGFTLDAAYAVTGDHPLETPGSAFWGRAPDHLPPSDPSSELIDAIRRLTHQGLVRRGDQDGAPRYALPETVRAQAMADLAASGESERIRARQATYLLALVEAIDRRVWTAEHPRLMTLLEAERANIRLVFAWAAGQARFDIVLRLAAGLYLFWETRGGISDGRQWLSRGLRAYPKTWHLEKMSCAHASWTKAR